MAGDSALFLLLGLGLVGFIGTAIWIQRHRYGTAGITEQQKSALGCQLASVVFLIALTCSLMSFMFLSANADIGQQAQSLYMVILVVAFIVAGYVAVSAIKNRAIIARGGPLTGPIAVLLGIMMIIGLIAAGGWFVFLFLKAR